MDFSASTTDDLATMKLLATEIGEYSHNPLVSVCLAHVQCDTCTFTISTFKSTQLCGLAGMRLQLSSTTGAV